MARKSSNGPSNESTGPWKGVRSLDDPYAVPPDYLLDASNGYIPDGKGGSGFYARPGFRRITNVSVVSDAIVAPIIRFTQGYETEGQVYRTAVGGALAPNGETQGSFTWHATGGRANGGYVTSVASVGVDGFGTPHGQFQAYPLAVGESPQPQGVIHKAFNLFGQTLTQPMRCLAFGASVGSGHFSPILWVQVNSDRTLQVCRPNLDDDVLGVLIGAPSTVTVPATGWWAVEFHRIGAPTGNLLGGVAHVNLYRDGDPVDGVAAIRATGVDLNGGVDGLNGENHYSYAWGTEVCRWLGAGLTGIGLDDGVIASGGGTVKRYLGDTYVGAAIPSRAGDATHSDIAYDSRFNYVHGTGPVTDALGVLTTHGDTDRWKNVDGSVARSRTELLNRATIDVSSGLGDVPKASVSYGLVGVFGEDWVDGPHIPPRYDTTGGPVDFDLTAEQAITRNTLYDDDLELYGVSHARTGVAVIEGVFPYARTGARWLSAVVRDAATPPANFFPLVSQKAYSNSNVHPNDQDQLRRYFRTVLRSGGVDAIGAAYKARAGGSTPDVADTAAADPMVDARCWYNRPGYALGQFIATDPATTAPFAPTALTLAQIGGQGDFAAYDTAGGDPDPAQRWVQVDLCEIGFEFPYHTAASRLSPLGAAAPIAGLVLSAGQSNLTFLFVTVYDVSVDWDDSIVTRTVDWGDGTDAEVFAGAGFAHRRSHNYAVAGTYQIVGRATDASGLVGTFTLHVTVTLE